MTDHPGRSELKRYRLRIAGEDGEGDGEAGATLVAYLQTKSVWCELSDDVQDPFVMKV